MPAIPLLSIDRLSVRFGQTPVINALSFDIAHGERVALVGESGSGKSVTAWSILRLLREATFTGMIRFNGDDLLQNSERQMCRLRGAQIAMISQEPMSALNPLYTIGKQIIETILLHTGVDAQHAHRCAMRLLARTGMPPHCIHHYPHQLSGGQCQRAMIAMALACQPQLLIADEPTTALDMITRKQIINLLLELQQQAGATKMAILLITHDLNLVRRFAERVAVIQKGVIVESGVVEQIFTTPQHPYTQQLLNSRAHRDVRPVSSTAPILLAAHHVSVEFRSRAAGIAGWFSSHRLTAVKNISFSLSQGETIGVVGESGSGKSTLAMALLGLQRVHQGEVALFGQSIASLRKGARGRQKYSWRAKIQIVFQDPYRSLSPRWTIEQIVGEGLALHRPELDAQARRSKIVAMLHEVGLDKSILPRYPHEFSGGGRQRIAIARVLVLEPQILVLDEPTSALDASIQQQILTLLAQLQHKYQFGYVLISHDLDVVQTLAHRILVMKNGAVVEAGETEKLISEPHHPYTKELLSCI